MIFPSTARFVSAVFSFFLPSKCRFCGKMLGYEEVFLCDDCLKLCGIFDKCPFCSLPLPGEGKCQHCAEKLKLPFAGLFYLGPYRSPLKESILAMKFNGYSRLAKRLGEELSKKIPAFEESVVFVPVPSSRKSLRQRGFNQARLMAESAARLLDGECRRKVLKLKGKKKNQMGLNREERAENMKGKMSEGEEFRFLRDRTVILIDDVMTTGATLKEAHRVLKKSGAKSIYAAVAAITVD
ncbi:ComF family protein [candidate division WOR-3 bacterium]|nr:ComF family protein [candidate division WOR-3 bacterium]